MLVGLVVTTPAVVPVGCSDAAFGVNAWWLAVAGIGNVAGLVLAAFAFRVGKVGVVAPILATEGALSAVIAARLGQSIAPSVGFILVVIVAGVVLAAGAPDPAPLEHERPIVSAVLATCAVFFFGIARTSAGHLSGEVPISWKLLPALPRGCSRPDDSTPH